MTDLWIVENGKPVPYQRLGSCNACGECCCFSAGTIFATFRTDPEAGTINDSSDEELSQCEGYSVFQDEEHWWWMKIEKTMLPRTTICSGFVEGKCTIWEREDWPSVCRYWPVHPVNLEQFPGCGFSFERADHEE